MNFGKLFFLVVTFSVMSFGGNSTSIGFNSASAEQVGIRLTAKGCRIHLEGEEKRKCIKEYKARQKSIRK